MLDVLDNSNRSSKSKVAKELKKSRGERSKSFPREKHSVHSSLGNQLMKLLGNAPLGGNVEKDRYQRFKLGNFNLDPEESAERLGNGRKEVRARERLSQYRATRVETRRDIYDTNG